MRTREEEWLLKEKYAGVESAEYRADAERLKKGEPVAYVIGFSPFLGARIDLSHRPLIPRPETEYWVERAISEVRGSFGSDQPVRCLDVFSGSGCIGIAVLMHVPNAHMHFIDIDPAALEQIRINLDLNGIDPARYEIYASDVFEGIPQGEPYDVIFANPPYIAHKDRDRVEDSVFEYEPHRALFAEGDGMELVEKTIRQAKSRLTPGGRLFLEHDDIQKEAIEGIIKTEPMFRHEMHKDQFGLWRWTTIFFADKKGPKG